MIEVVLIGILYNWVFALLYFKETLYKVNYFKLFLFCLPPYVLGLILSFAIVTDLD